MTVIKVIKRVIKWNVCIMSDGVYFILQGCTSFYRSAARLTGTIDMLVVTRNGVCTLEKWKAL